MKEKKALESAKSVVEVYMTKAMEQRHAEWEQKKQAFLTKKMNELKEAILEHARAELQKDVNKQRTAQKAAERAARDKAIAEKKKLEGAAEEEDLMIGKRAEAAGAADGWQRGTRK